MQRYFFHTVGSSREPDLEGVDLPHDRAAQDLAVRFAGELLRDDPGFLRERGTCMVQVTTTDGALIFTFTASALVAAAGG